MTLAPDLAFAFLWGHDCQRQCCSSSSAQIQQDTRSVFRAEQRFHQRREKHTLPVAPVMVHTTHQTPDTLIPETPFLTFSAQHVKSQPLHPHPAEFLSVTVLYNLINSNFSPIHTYFYPRFLNCVTMVIDVVIMCHKISRKAELSDMQC